MSKLFYFVLLHIILIIALGFFVLTHGIYGRMADGVLALFVSPHAGEFYYSYKDLTIYALNFKERNYTIDLPDFMYSNATNTWGVTNERGIIVIESRLPPDIQYQTCIHEVCHNYVHVGGEQEEEICNQIMLGFHHPACARLLKDEHCIDAEVRRDFVPACFGWSCDVVNGTSRCFCIEKSFYPEYRNVTRCEYGDGR